MQSVAPPLRLSLLLAACSLGACAAPLEGEARGPLALIPSPAFAEQGAGRFQVAPSLEVVMEDPALLEMELDERLLEVIDPAKKRKLIAASYSLRPRGRVVVDLSGDLEQLGEEGYALRVDEGGIELRAARPVGIFYGIQTLRQLLPAPGDYAPDSSWSLPHCEIVDRPRFGWRGQLLDVSRHFLPLEFIKKNIDYLASLKLNVFHWHLSDDQGWRLELEELPKLTSIGAWRVDRNDEPWWGRAEQQPGEQATYGGFYSRDEVREVLEYARLRGVTVVPELDMPGHSRAVIAAYPELSCDGAQLAVATGGIADTNTYCPGKEASFVFVEKVLASVIELFPSEYIHIGGDECNKRAWRSCADCQARMHAEELEDVEELQSYFIKRVERMINARGRKMIGWDEILEGGLAPNAVVMSWRGEAGGITAAQAGHEVIMTPGNYCYLDLKQGDPETEPELGYSQLLLSTAYSYEPIPEVLTSAQAEYILGIQGNLWSESIQHEGHANYMLFPRLFAIAEVAWSPAPRRSWEDFMARLEPALERLGQRGIGYAPSLYQVALRVDDEPQTEGVELSMGTEHGALEIRYTLDGSPPSASSARYRRPIRLGATTEVQAASFRAGKRLGRVTKRVVELHRAIGKSVTSATPWSEKYPAGGPAALTDGRRGSLNYSDGRWLAFEGTDLDATIDLGQSQALEAVSLSCLEVQGSWIFLPTSVEVLASEDGQAFESLGQRVIDSSARSAGEHRRSIRIEAPGAEARYLRVRASNLMRCPDWHLGAGGKTWLFVDEVVVH